MSSILAINGLKITRNPRISLSVFPRSGDITESILYIFNVRSEEGGTYSCGVSTDPMILQVRSSYAETDRQLPNFPNHFPSLG